ncbi:hypothetical protein BBP40_010892, partial [Aspergillus hancockii]
MTGHAIGRQDTPPLAARFGDSNGRHRTPVIGDPHQSQPLEEFARQRAAYLQGRKEHQRMQATRHRTPTQSLGPHTPDWARGISTAHSERAQFVHTTEYIGGTGPNLAPTELPSIKRCPLASTSPAAASPRSARSQLVDSAVLLSESVPGELRQSRTASDRPPARESRGDDVLWSAEDLLVDGRRSRHLRSRHIPPAAARSPEDRDHRPHPPP